MEHHLQQQLMEIQYVTPQEGSMEHHLQQQLMEI